MEISNYFTRLFSFCLLFMLATVYGVDVCVKRTACSCVFSNGTGIDLAPSAKGSIYQSKNTFEDKSDGKEIVLSTYFYHPCYDVLMKMNGSAPINGSTCNSALALCRHTRTYNGTEADKLVKYGEAYDLLGTSNITADSSSGPVFAEDGSFIKYFHVPSYTKVNLVCAETDDELYVKDLSDPNELKLDFLSRNACLRQIESTRSVGSTLLIIFFCFVIFYLVLGVCTKKFLMGATGIEVVPNLMFWTELPNLVRDGWAFARSGFKLPTRGPGPSTSPDPNSYDSI